MSRSARKNTRIQVATAAIRDAKRRQRVTQHIIARHLTNEIDFVLRMLEKPGDSGAPQIRLRSIAHARHVHTQVRAVLERIDLDPKQLALIVDKLELLRHRLDPME